MSVGTEGSGPNPRTYSRAEYAALEAENARLTAQLAAIQGGMGEVVEVVAWRIEHPVSQWKVYEQRQDWAYQQYGHIKYQVQDLMTVAQHQRITAAMAAEVERLKQQIDNYRSQFGELHIARNLLSRLSRAGFEIGDDLAASIIALRAELAEVKGREAVPVAWMDEDGCLHTTLESATFRRRPVTPLYTTPPASPDVDGLVKALEADFPLLDDNGLDETLHHCEWNIQQERKRLHAALSTWRQAQEVKP